MTVTAIEHYDEKLGKGYYLVSEDIEKTWYKGETAKEAVFKYVKEHKIKDRTITIVERV